MLIHRGEHCYCGLNGGNGFFGTCPCLLCGGITCSPHRIQTLKTNQKPKWWIILTFLSRLKNISKILKSKNQPQNLKNTKKKKLNRGTFDKFVENIPSPTFRVD